VLLIVINLYNELGQGETVAYFILKELSFRLEICGLFIIIKNNTEKVIKSETHNDLIGNLIYAGVKTDVYKSGKGREKISLILA
jgi:hypothetical protein